MHQDLYSDIRGFVFGRNKGWLLDSRHNVFKSSICCSVQVRWRRGRGSIAFRRSRSILRRWGRWSWTQELFLLYKSAVMKSRIVT